MGFPSKEKIKKIVKNLEHTEGTLSLSPNASALERFRFEVQQEFVKYKQAHGLTGADLAEILGIDRAKTSKILRHRIAEFSTDRLLSLLVKIHPEAEYKVRKNA